MTIEELEHRITAAEEDIKTLFGKTNKMSLEMATVTTKLDNMLVTLGELKESVNRISSRPSQLWDKLIFGVIGAVAAAIGSAIIQLFY